MNSKSVKILGIAIVAVCTVMAFHTVSAQEPAAAPAAKAPVAAAPAIKPAIKPAVTSVLELRKTGIISVVKDADGKVTGLKLIVNSYEIPIDEGSKPLESMDGQKVRVIGTFSNEGGRRMFYVKSVEPVAVKGAAAPAK